MFYFKIHLYVGTKDVCVNCLSWVNSAFTVDVEDNLDFTPKLPFVTYCEEQTSIRNT